MTESTKQGIVTCVGIVLSLLIIMTGIVVGVTINHPYTTRERIARIHACEKAPAAAIQGCVQAVR